MKDKNANPPNSKYSMSTEKKKEKDEWSEKRDDEKARFLWAGGKSCTSWLRGVCVRRSSPGTVVLSSYQGCYSIVLTLGMTGKNGRIATGNTWYQCSGSDFSISTTPVRYWSLAPVREMTKISGQANDWWTTKRTRSTPFKQVLTMY